MHACNIATVPRTCTYACTRTERRDRVLAEALADWCKTTRRQPIIVIGFSARWGPWFMPTWWASVTATLASAKAWRTICARAFHEAARSPRNASAAPACRSVHLTPKCPAQPSSCRSRRYRGRSPGPCTIGIAAITHASADQSSASTPQRGRYTHRWRHNVPTLGSVEAVGAAARVVAGRDVGEHARVLV